ncbi:branched-chain amino acid ABC transporter permease [Bradyrhizobium sp. NP1]|uniref:branched-chain amino acid ABC transporter permease n=1 Tax=Bradyrhizobium sp. NP1 TaxID=3049772 RepID=UPI0025A4FF2B|nr:branched-chain amino acid ABC transporter permease [Bradyrhizobium sp. NP1]WJR80857.1 branched-chain amino acid ABC transporter permease [Bradyrhizobium sp. NP1]
MDLIPQYLFNGLVVGSSYALIALGLTAIFGLMNLANFAHGQFYMLGGFVGFWLTRRAGLPFFLAVGVTTLVVGCAGYFLEKFLFRRLRSAPLMSSVLATIGLAIVLENGARLLWGPSPERIFSGLPSQSIELFGALATPERLITIVLTFVLIGLLEYSLYFTRAGMEVRATFQQKEAAALVGINIERLYALTFALGAGLAALAGVMLGSIFVVQPSMGGVATLKAFIVVILGGLGNFLGAIAGGLLLGMAESFGSIVSSAYKDAIGFVLVIAVLLYKPDGLFGKR